MWICLQYLKCRGKTIITELKSTKWEEWTEGKMWKEKKRKKKKILLILKKLDRQGKDLAYVAEELSKDKTEQKLSVWNI